MLSADWLEALPDAHLIVMPGGRVAAANRKAADLVPATHHSLQVLADAAVPPTEFTVISHGLRRVISAAITPIEWHASPARLVRLMDLTLQREQQALQEEGIQVLEEIFDALPASMVVLDSLGTIVAANARWRIGARANGLAYAQDGIGVNYLEVCDRVTGAETRYAREAAAGIRDVLTHRALAFEMDYDMMVPTGSESYRMMVTALEQTRGAVVQHTDMSAIRAEQRARSAAAAHFEATFTQALDAMILLDLGGKFLETNAAASALFALEETQLRGQRLERFAAPEAAADLARFLLTMSARGLARAVLRLVRADGKPVWVECAGRAHVVADRHLVVLRDVTEVRDLEALLRQAQKMEALGQLTGGIAHDFNNILTVVQGNTDAILMDEADRSLPEEAREGLRDVIAAARRGAEMVRKLMAFSRKDQLHRSPQRLDQLIREFASLLGRVLPESIKVHVAVEDALPPVNADPNAIQQILFNLATNARDAIAGDSGQLGIQLASREGTPLPEVPARLGRYVEVRVSDNGCGMTEDVLRRVFEPFFTTKPMGQGTGLGMAMVYGLMAQQEGSVAVESEPGRGTTVILRFPAIAETTPVPAAPRVLGPPARGSERILLVEDDSHIRLLACRILRGAGYTVHEVVNGTEARAHLAHQLVPPDLVLSDVVMPGGGGDEVARAVEEIVPDVPVLWVTGYATDGIPKRGPLARGNRTVLQKPWAASELLRAVRTELDVAARALTSEVRS